MKFFFLKCITIIINSTRIYSYTKQWDLRKCSTKYGWVVRVH